MTPSPSTLSFAGTTLATLVERQGAKRFIGLDPTGRTQLPPVVAALGRDARCLYKGAAQEEYGATAPWIVEDDEHGTVCDYLLEEHLGENCFVVFVSRMSFDEFHLKMRKLTKIIEVGRGERYWRMFRPDGLGTLIPFFTIDQRQMLLGDLEAACMEIHEGPAVGFGSMAVREDGSLRATSFVPDQEGSGEAVEVVIGDVATELPPAMRPSLEGAKARPRLTLTTAQMEAPILFNRPKLLRSTIDALKPEFAPALAVLPENQAAMHVNHGINLAVGYDLWDVTAIQTFVDIMFRVAPGWHRQKDLRAVLQRTDLAPMERLEMVVTEPYDAAWEEARRLDAVEEWYPDGFLARDA